MVAALTTVRLHKNVASGGGAARGRQYTRAYYGSKMIDVRPLDEPRRRHIGVAGRAALVERMEWRGTGARRRGTPLSILGFRVGAWGL